MKKILLICLPPFIEAGASPAFSVLKAYLEKFGYNAHVKYWNIEMLSLLKSFFNFPQNGVVEKDINKLLPFFIYKAIKTNDIDLIERIRYEIYKNKPSLHYRGKEYLCDYFKKITLEIDNFFDNALSKIDFKDYLFVGFSALFYQWIVANIVTDKILKMSPKTIFVLGGLGSKNEAEAILRNFNNYTYTIWGEGEHSLMNLTKYIDKKKMEIESISNIAFRKENGDIYCAKSRNIFVDMNELNYDYSDYFVVNKCREKTIAYFEGGRGCHWNKCHFCFLNSGYKYRVKKPEKIIDEIRGFIKNYEIKRIAFLDNDIIGNDLNRFDLLLDLLIELKSEYDFEIVLSEIITKGIDYRLIKKMNLAGFKNVQIGYESPSDKLLKKIHKKNTFASNIFFIKWGLYFGFNILNPHIIRNLLEETNDNILEGIKNLYYLRFYIDTNRFKHHIVNLSIAKNSPYYKTLHENGLINKYQDSSISNFLPQNYIDFKDQFILFFDNVDFEYNKLWDIFSSIESFYLDNLFTYRLVNCGEFIRYEEFFNNTLLKKIDFDKNSIIWIIMEKYNYSSESIYTLKEGLKLVKFESNGSLEKAIMNLNKEGLLYCNDELTEIVSIINTDLLI